MAILCYLCLLYNEWSTIMGNRSDGSRVDGSPAFLLNFFQKPYGLDFKLFWIVTHGIHELIFITALVFNWKIKKRRNLIVLVLVGHITIRVWTLLYFAPTIMEFQQLPYSDTIDVHLQEKAAQWRNLNYVRVAVFFALNFLLISALKIKEKYNE